MRKYLGVVGHGAAALVAAPERKLRRIDPCPCALSLDLQIGAAAGKLLEQFVRERVPEGREEGDPAGQYGGVRHGIGGEGHRLQGPVHPRQGFVRRRVVDHSHADGGHGDGGQVGAADQLAHRPLESRRARLGEGSGQAGEAEADLSKGEGGQGRVRQNVFQECHACRGIGPVDCDAGEGEGRVGAVLDGQGGFSEELLQKVGGDAVVTDRDGLVGGGQGTGEPGPGVAELAGVVGDPHQRRRLLLGQRVHRPPVQSEPAGAEDPVVDRSAGQHVPEAVPPGRRLAQDAGLQRRLQTRLGLLLLQPRQRRQEFLGGRYGQDGGGLHHRHSLRGENREPAVQRLLQRPGHPHVLQGLHPVSRGSGEPVGHRQQVLLRHQRKPLTALEQAATERGGRGRPDHRHGELSHLTLGERTEGDLRASDADRPPVRRAQHIAVLRQVLRPIGQDQPQILRRIAGEQQQQVSCRLVHPVQVLHSQHHRSQHPQKLVHCPHQALRVASGLGISSSTPLVGRKLPGDSRQIRCQRSGGGAELRLGVDVQVYGAQRMTGPNGSGSRNGWHPPHITVALSSLPVASLRSRDFPIPASP